MDHEIRIGLCLGIGRHGNCCFRVFMSIEHAGKYPIQGLLSGVVYEEQLGLQAMNVCRAWKVGFAHFPLVFLVFFFNRKFFLPGPVRPVWPKIENFD